eukprot:14303426-Alexandrium_andersonii.AAC.1
MSASLVGSEMCIRDSPPPCERNRRPGPLLRRARGGIPCGPGPPVGGSCRSDLGRRPQCAGDRWPPLR